VQHENPLREDTQTIEQFRYEIDQMIREHHRQLPRSGLISPSRLSVTLQVEGDGQTPAESPRKFELGAVYKQLKSVPKVA